MILAPMSFKNYTWPHNPSSFEVTYKRELVSYKSPFGNTFIRDMGRSYRVFKGEGEFAGAGAYDSFKALEAIFDEGTSGLLYHPVWKEVRAYFASLSLAQEPAENYVRYTFEFWEDVGENDSVSVASSTNSSGGDIRTSVSNEVNNGLSGGTYTVLKGDTMWGIASANGLSVQELIAKNPQIGNLNLILPGDIIYI